MTELSSTAYLAGYVACIVAAVILVRLQVAGADVTRGFAAPPVTTERDPSEIAYLRGDGFELLRFRVFELVRRGYLQIAGDAPGAKKPRRPDRLERAAQPPNPNLDALDLAILAFYDSGPQTTKQLFASPLPQTAGEFGTATYRGALERDGMYAGSAMLGAGRRWAAYAVLVLLAIALWRLVGALARGHHNVGFLIVLALVGVVVVVASAAPSRLSARGRTFLARLQRALGPARGASVLAGAATLPIFVAASGMGALAGTEYAPIDGMFRRQASASGNGGGACNSCGSGSSGSGSSGSSCGGGGGCGGGCGG